MVQIASTWDVIASTCDVTALICDVTLSTLLLNLEKVSRSIVGRSWKPAGTLSDEVSAILSGTVKKDIKKLTNDNHSGTSIL